MKRMSNCKECDHIENLYQNLYEKSQELNKVKQELKLYKKALWVACNGHQYLVNDFLEKAGE